MTEKIVTDVLVNFAKQIEMNIEDIQSLSVNDSELLLKKLLACQTKDVSHFVCAMLDSEEAQRINTETSGSVWNIGQNGAALAPEFYEYIFNNAEISADSNETFQNFKKFIAPTYAGPLDDKKALRLFHALNLRNMREEVCAALPALQTDNFKKNEICRRMTKYLEEDEGGDRSVVQNDIAALWDHQVRFPFFKDKRVVLGSNNSPFSAEEPGAPTAAAPAAAAGARPLCVAPIAAIRANAYNEMRANPLLKRFCLVASVPLSYPIQDAARQLFLVTTSSDPTRIEEDLVSLLHRDQNIEYLQSAALKEKLDAVPNKEVHFKQLVSAFAHSSLPEDLHERINKCPECATVASAAKATESSLGQKGSIPTALAVGAVGADVFLGNFLYHYWKTNGNLGNRWIAEISSK